VLVNKEISNVWINAKGSVRIMVEVKRTAAYYAGTGLAMNHLLNG